MRTTTCDFCGKLVGSKYYIFYGTLENRSGLPDEVDEGMELDLCYDCGTKFINKIKEQTGL